MKRSKSVILITLIVLSIIGLILGLYLILSKFDDINIMSVQNEYNLVINSNDDSMSVPIYFSNKKSFLTNKKSIEKVELINDQNTMLVSLDSIEYTETIKYDEQKFYEFIFNIKFDQYDDFNEPLFMSGVVLKATYTNGEDIDYQIGNLNIYINKNEIENSMTVRRLYAVTNDVSLTETIVGINFSFYNPTDKDITINSIKTKNKFYELDYMNYKDDLIGSKEALTSVFDNYSYTAKQIENGQMSLTIKPNEEVSLFIPLKYLNGIKYLDRLPFFIEYEIDSVNKKMVIDDFQFMKKKYIVFDNGISKYVYRYK